MPVLFRDTEKLFQRLRERIVHNQVFAIVFKEQSQTMNSYTELLKDLNYHDPAWYCRLQMLYLKGKELREKVNKLSSSKIIFDNQSGVKFCCAVEISDQENTLSHRAYVIWVEGIFVDCCIYLQG